MKASGSNKIKTIWTCIFLLMLILCILIFSLQSGTIYLNPIEVVQTLLGFGTPDNSLILLDFRLPRIIITILAGFALGISGTILQSVTKNPMADTSVIGIQAGSGLGLISFIAIFDSLHTNITLIPIFSMCGGLVAGILVLALAYDRQKGLMSIRVLLVGISVSAGFHALMLVLSLRLDESTYSFAAQWLVGNVWAREWKYVWLMIPFLIILIPILFFRANTLNLLQLKEETAIGVGVKTSRQRFYLLVISIILSSISFSMVGGIAFVGLIAPHLSRKLVGRSHQHILPVSGLIGILILLTADTTGRVLFSPNGMPAGVLCAAIGAPYFLYLLKINKK